MTDVRRQCQKLYYRNARHSGRPVMCHSVPLPADSNTTAASTRGRIRCLAAAGGGVATLGRRPLWHVTGLRRRSKTAASTESSLIPENNCRNILVIQKILLPLQHQTMPWGIPGGLYRLIMRA